MLNRKLDMISHKYFLIGLNLFVFGLILFVPDIVGAQSLTSDINKTTQVFAGDNGAGLKNSDPRLIVSQVITVVISILGTLLTAWTVYGGFLILNSAGDSDKIDQGKGVIRNGVIGLVLVLSSYAIATFVYRMWAQPATRFEQDPKPVIDTNLYEDPNAGDQQIS